MGIFGITFPEDIIIVSLMFSCTCTCTLLICVSSACTTKFCRRDLVLKYVVIGGKKDFQVESGLFRDLLWSIRTSCRKHQNAELLKTR